MEIMIQTIEQGDGDEPDPPERNLLLFGGGNMGFGGSPCTIHGRRSQTLCSRYRFSGRITFNWRNIFFGSR